MLLAPGLFSTTTGWPRLASSFWAMMRVSESVMPAGVYGTIHLMGRGGYCACTGPATRSVATDSSAAMVACGPGMLPRSVCAKAYTGGGSPVKAGRGGSPHRGRGNVRPGRRSRRNHCDRWQHFITASRTTTASFALDPEAPSVRRFCGELPRPSRTFPHGLMGLCGEGVPPKHERAALSTKRVGDEAVPLERRAVVLRRIDGQVVPLGQVRTMRWLPRQAVIRYCNRWRRSLRPHRRVERNRLGTTRSRSPGREEPPRHHPISAAPR